MHVVQRAVLPSPTVVLRAGAATSAGNRRRVNEDAYAVGDRVCVVADGMGGHAAGDVAARLAVRTIVAQVESASAVGPGTVIGAVRAAHAAVRTEAATRTGADGMGTTAVVVAAVEAAGRAALAVVHVGDSRCYAWRDAALRLVTRDHSLVQELVDAGRLDPSAAAGHPLANVVTRALGVDADVEPALALLDAVPCRLLLCSDGLHGELPARAIGRVLAGVADPQAAADRLVELVLLGPARDNVTAVVVDVTVGAGVLDTPAAVDHDGARPAGRAP